MPTGFSQPCQHIFNTWKAVGKYGILLFSLLGGMEGKNSQSKVYIFTVNVLEGSRITFSESE